MARRYRIYDVFTDKKLAGNPLAVVLDGDDLDTDRMQAIAREMNLSETVFVQTSEQPAHAARLRIFTPGRELPFAGHPTVGTAVALAELDQGEGADVDLVRVLEESVGPVRCAIRLRPGEAGFAEFDLPKRPWRIDLPLEREKLADAFSLKVTDIGFENHVASIWSAGVAFLMVPVRNLAAVQSLEFDPMIWEKSVPFVEGALASAYVYCRGGQHHQANSMRGCFRPTWALPKTRQRAARLRPLPAPSAISMRCRMAIIR